MKGNVYLLINEGEIIVASNNKEYIEDTKETKSEEAMADTAESWGRDMEDMTQEELAEVSFGAGFDGGYYYVSKIKVPDNYNSDDSFTTEEDDEFTYGEVEDAYIEVEDY